MIMLNAQKIAIDYCATPNKNSVYQQRGHRCVCRTENLKSCVCLKYRRSRSSVFKWRVFGEKQENKLKKVVEAADEETARTPVFDEENPDNVFKGRETILGVEMDSNASLPREYEKDFWEGEQFEIIGKISSVFIPIVVVLALAVGGFAAKVYNEGANTYIIPATEAEQAEFFVPDSMK